jgi:hypothetical protein
MIVQRLLPSEILAPWTHSETATTDLRDLSITELALACQREETRFLLREPSDPRFGYELFRRAICLSDAAAWHALIEQYRAVLRVWVKRHPALGAAGGDADDWVYQAFSRFWLAVRPERFDQFSDLASLLRYLKLCVHSLLVDAARAYTMGPQPLDPLAEDGAELPDVALTVATQMTGDELWRVVLDEVQDEAERLLVRLSFVQGLRPRDVQARHPERFPSVADAYRVKRNLLDRLRRSPRMARFAA